jgi:HK97 family phage prohead protease
VLILPIPIPNKNEDHNDFMDRCLSDKLMNSEYPDNKQRYAICQASWDKSKKRSDSSMEELRKVISYNAAHGKIGYVDEAWDGPKMEANLKNDETGDYYKKAFAYIDSEANPDTKAAYKFIHHMVDSEGNIGLANLKACSAGIAILNGGRGGTNIPKDEYQGVYDHLVRHLKDAGREEIPELKRSKPQRYETRTLTLRSEDIKADEKIVAKIASFDSRSQNLGGFYEKISPGAFKKTIQESDIRALLNHDSNYVLGRVKSGTITLEEREDGLYMNCTPPDTQWARDLMVSIGRGDIDQCSFGFRVIKDSYNEENGDIVRSLHEVELFDVSVVTYPAYLNTSAFVRSFNRSDLMKDLVNSVEAGKITEEKLKEHLRLLLNEPEEDLHSNNKNQNNEPSKTLINKRSRELELLENQIKN